MTKSSARGRGRGRGRRSVSKRSLEMREETHPGIENASISIGYNVYLDMDGLRHIYAYLEAMGLIPLLESNNGFSSTLVKKFYNNLRNPGKAESHGVVHSVVQGHSVSITHDDLRSVYGLRAHGYMLDIVERFKAVRDWTHVNRVLHHREGVSDLITTVSTLTQDARIIQDILRHTIMCKHGDTKRVTAQLSMVTYHILQRESFDVADLILSIIRYTYRLKDPSRKRLNNLCLGGVIQRVLYWKYPYILRDEYPIDCFPSDYTSDDFPTDIPQPTRASVSPPAPQPPLKCGGSVRDTNRELLRLLREQGKELQALRLAQERTRNRQGILKRMMRFIIKGLSTRPTSTEEDSWRESDDERPEIKYQYHRRNYASDTHRHRAKASGARPVEEEHLEDQRDRAPDQERLQTTEEYRGYYKMKRSSPWEDAVTISLDDSSDSNSEEDNHCREKRSKSNGAFESFKDIMSEGTLIRTALMYQDYMKRIPIPTFSSSVVPFTSWQGLAESMKVLYKQPLHFLTNVLVKQWDGERIGSDDEQQPLDSVVHPLKAQTLIWLAEELHRLTSSPHHLAKLWASDPMYHSHIDPFLSY